MSNSHRYAHNSRQDGNSRNNPKTHKKFVPKNQNQTSTPTRSSLSASLRQTDAASSTTGGVTTGSTGRRGLSCHGGNFVNYLPQDEAVAAGFGADEGGLDAVESQRVVDLSNRELSRLLKLNPKEFWKEVATDTSLHEFLDSFLQFRSRWYDLPHCGAKGIVAGVIVGELELSRRVFMLLYRF
ncbi:hypothetical protein SLA2020_489590 [Shorea laevis]